MKLICKIWCVAWTMSVFGGWEEEIAVRGISARWPLLYRQYTDWRLHASPKIADMTVKSIPIKESREPLVDIRDRNRPRIRMLSSPPSFKPFEGPDYYAGYPESSQVRLSVELKMEKLLEVLDGLAPEFGHTAGHFSIRVFEGLRSIKTQTRLFENKMREIQGANPEWSGEQVEAEAAKWVSPVKNNVPAHSTGGAIDLRLYDDTIKQFFDMGPFGVIWGSNQTAPTFSADLSDAQIKNRLFLLCGTAQVGLVNYPYEWWHFSSRDRYAAYYNGLQNGTENPFAIYDKVE